MDPHTVFDRNLSRARGLLDLHPVLHGRRGRPRQHTSDLVRAVIVFGVAALDAYVHQKVVASLNPAVLASPSLKLKERSKLITRDRPELLLKIAAAPSAFDAFLEEFEATLATDTLQHPGAIQSAFEMVGHPNIWASVAAVLGQPEVDIKKTLAEYVERRHKIAHEADLEAGEQRVQARRITRRYADECLTFLKTIVDSIEAIT